jgi:hypothetical protein
MEVETIALIFSVAMSGIAIIGLLVTLFYFIFELRTRRQEWTKVEQRLARLEGRFEQWSPFMQQVLPDLLLKKYSNPDG